MSDVARINDRWEALADRGLVIQLSDGQRHLTDARWKPEASRADDVLVEGPAPPGAQLVARTVGTTLLWKRDGRCRAWRSSVTVHEFRPTGAAPAPELAQLPRYAR